MSLTIRPGFAPQDRALVGHLYWQAFGGKLGRVMTPEIKALAFIDRVLRPDHALSAYDQETLLGVVGFKTPKGAFVGGGFSDLAAVYGPLGALWRAGVLHLLERDVENVRFLMDGLFVRPEARGQGVGTALIEAITREGAARGYAELRLDVIDTNPRAKALYERSGFRAVAVSDLGPLRHIFGFSSATTMVRPTAG